MSISQMSFSSAVLIVVITVIRAMTINKMPKKTFLALWAVAVLRLLIPFSVPSPLSVYSLISGSSAVTEKIAQAPAAYIFPMMPFAQTQSENSAVALSAGISPKSIAQIPVPSTAAAMPLWTVWGTGTALFVLYFAIAYIRFYKRFQTSIVVKNSFTAEWLEEHKMIRTIRVRQSGRITTPLTYGIFRPVILMPETIDWSDKKQLRYILTHEYVHIRRFDTAVKLLLTAALCIHWFNPLVWVMYILANRDLELVCDESVVSYFGETVKSSYALTLLKLEEQKNVFAPYYSGFSKNASEERIFAIMKYRKSSAIATVLAALLVVGTTTAFASSALPSADANSLIDEEAAEYNMAQEAATEALVIYNAEAIKAFIESYSEYGLVLNQLDGRLYYENQLVKCFSVNYIEQAVYLDGVIDVNATISSSGELIGIEPYSRQEFIKQTTTSLSESAFIGFDEIWNQAREAVHSGVVFWPLPYGQKEADWNYSAWSAVWRDEWQKAEADGYLEQLKYYVTNRLIIAADDSGSWRNLYQEFYNTSVGLLES